MYYRLNLFLDSPVLHKKLFVMTLSLVRTVLRLMLSQRSLHKTKNAKTLLQKNPGALREYFTKETGDLKISDFYLLAADCRGKVFFRRKKNTSTRKRTQTQILPPPLQ